jgi:hypothetical protein
MIEEVSKKARAAINDLILRIEKLQGVADDIEDRYRQSGLTYHRTQHEARRESDYEPELLPRRARCEEAFQFTCVEEYGNLFEPLHSVVQRLSDLRSQAQHLPSIATATELMHQIYYEFLPKMGDLIAEFEEISKQFDQLHEDSNILLNYSKCGYSIDELDHRVVWHDAVPTVPYRTSENVWRDQALRCEGFEYQLFRDWLQSLPETARAIRAGTSLDNIALGILWEGFDEFSPTCD